MDNIGTCEYAIGVIHDKDIWYYIGETDPAISREDNIAEICPECGLNEAI